MTSIVGLGLPKMAGFSKKWFSKRGKQVRSR